MSGEHKHWSEWLAERVIEEKKEPYIITGGMTTSGPVHFGTLCEFLFPASIKRALEARGKIVEFYFVADILDAFDSVPLAMEQYKSQLEPHLGKPLCDVPDPTGKSRSFGEHYLDEARGLMAKFGIGCTIIRINEYYQQGKFDEWARFYLKHESEARKIVEETSGREEKKEWSPLMPICEKCGRIATTRVLSHDGESYEYACDKDAKYVKGCGHRGKAKIADHRYKIVWRLHWPAWKQIFHSSIEGAGMDHHTKGGSEDTCREITQKLMKAEYHIPFKYGFILFQGKKYSKSKGIGMGISDMVKLVPPETIKYMLVKPDLEENVDINPTAENLLRTMEDFQKAAELSTRDMETLNRHERKMAIAYGLSADRLEWKVQFIDALLYYQIYQDWKEVAKLTGDPDGVEYLRPYIEEWIAQDFMPDDYRFSYQPDPSKASGAVKGFVAGLTEGMDALAVHNAVFDFAKSGGMDAKALFAEIYQTILGKEKGPRMGKLIVAIGIGRLKKDMGL